VRRERAAVCNRTPYPWLGLTSLHRCQSLSRHLSRLVHRRPKLEAGSGCCRRRTCQRERRWRLPGTGGCTTASSSSDPLFVCGAFASGARGGLASPPGQREMPWRRSNRKA